MNRRAFIRILGGGAALGLASGVLLRESAGAQPRGRGGPPPKKKGRRWVHLGDKQVSFGVERDAIRVSRRDGAFGAIGLEAIGADVHVIELVVHFRDRSSVRLRLDEVIREN